MDMTCLYSLRLQTNDILYTRKEVEKTTVIFVYFLFVSLITEVGREHDLGGQVHRLLPRKREMDVGKVMGVHFVREPLPRLVHLFRPELQPLSQLCWFHP